MFQISEDENKRILEDNIQNDNIDNFPGYIKS